MDHAQTNRAASSSILVSKPRAKRPSVTSKTRTSAALPDPLRSPPSNQRRGFGEPEATFTARQPCPSPKPRRDLPRPHLPNKATLHHRPSPLSTSVRLHPASAAFCIRSTAEASLSINDATFRALSPATLVQFSFLVRLHHVERITIIGVARLARCVHTPTC